MRTLSSSLIFSLALGLVAPLPLEAASIVAADDGGYAGRVIEKVGQVWSPPPGLRGNFSVRIRIRVGEDGKVRECKATEPSSLKAFDDAACGAVHNAAPFGKTPEGKPVDVHMAFRIGAPKKAPRELTFEEAARESVKERERLDNLIANEQAGFVETRARERAEAIAKKLGVDLSDLNEPPKETSRQILPPPSQFPSSPVKEAKPEKPAKPEKKAPVADNAAGVFIGSTNQNKGPELVIKSNLKHLDAALEAQSEATAEAQAPSANSPITIVTPQTPKAEASATPKAQAVPEGGKVVIIPQQKIGGNGSLTDDELAVPPLESLVAEIELLPPARAEQNGGAKPQPEAKEQKVTAPEKTAKSSTADAPKASAHDRAETKVSDVKSDVKPDTTPADAKKSDKAPAKVPVAEPVQQSQQAQQPKQAEQAAPAPAKVTPVDENMSYADYLERIRQDIQQKIRLPKLPSGRHIVSVQLYLSRSGRIRRADLIHNSSNIRRDEAMAEAVKEVGKITPPPAALGQHFPLTLVFEVQ